jgi:hypothetical protein
VPVQLELPPGQQQVPSEVPLPVPVQLEPPPGQQQVPVLVPQAPSQVPEQQVPLPVPASSPLPSAGKLQMRT